MIRETRARALGKMLTWSALGAVLLGGLSFAFALPAVRAAVGAASGLEGAALAGLIATAQASIYLAIRSGAYLLHERAWDRVKAGRELVPGCVVWLTGLPCSGKSSIAAALARELEHPSRAVKVLDGEVLRRGLCVGLGFSREDREESLRRIREAAKLLVDAGAIVIVAAVTPFDEERVRVRLEIQRSVVVFVDTPPEVCEARDAKGLWRRARAGELPGFTGVSDVFERPLTWAIDATVSTTDQTPEECASQVRAELARRAWA